MAQLILYGTVGCHLCEVAEQLLKTTSGAEHYRYVDIADDDELLERFGIRIPVLFVEGAERDLGWPFDEAQVLDYLHACG